MTKFGNGSEDCVGMKSVCEVCEILHGFVSRTGRGKKVQVDGDECDKVAERVVILEHQAHLAPFTYLTLVFARSQRPFQQLEPTDQTHQFVESQVHVHSQFCRTL